MQSSAQITVRVPLRGFGRCGLNLGDSAQVLLRGWAQQQRIAGFLSKQSALASSDGSPVEVLPHAFRGPRARCDGAARSSSSSFRIPSASPSAESRDPCRHCDAPGRSRATGAGRHHGALHRQSFQHLDVGSGRFERGHHHDIGFAVERANVGDELQYADSRSFAADAAAGYVGPVRPGIRAGDDGHCGIGNQAENLLSQKAECDHVREMAEGADEQQAAARRVSGSG